MKYVRIMENSLNLGLNDVFPKGKRAGDLLRCYRHELLFDDSGPSRVVREQFFLVEARTHDNDVYVSTPEDYGAVAFHDPELPEHYSSGSYTWVTDSEVELIEVNNKAMSSLLTKEEWQLYR